MPEPVVLHVVSHTHWDREWYQPLEVFRLRLVDLLDHLLLVLREDPDFVHFHLDSQCIVLEDYLAVRPEREAELREHIAAGRVEVGPWYVLNDTFLTSGEATIRNLLVGRAIARRFGGHGDIGYVPDQFGSIAQLPQIFAGFGLRYAVVGRGITVQDVPLEFAWRSPDGSTVLTSLLHGWYNNAQRLDAVPVRAAQQLRRAVEHLRAHSDRRHFLLMNGVDHLEAQENLSSILAAVRPLLEPWEVRHSTLAAYFAGLEAEEGRPWSQWTGELRQQRQRHSVLNGTLSSRMSLKLQNHRCQLLLERWVEPWSTVAGLLGGEVPQAQLRLGWRYLMQNHPHDSICGCSVDPVHREMETRFASVTQIGEILRQRALHTVCQHVPAPSGSVLVFNPTSHTRAALCTITLDFPPGDGEQVVLRDAMTGERVPFRLLERRAAQRLATNPVALPHPVPSDRFTLRALVRDLPAFGYRTLIAERVRGPVYRYGEGAPPQDEGLSAFLGTGEMGGRNEHLALRIAPDGTFSLEVAGVGVFHGLGRLIDDGEAGDSYLHEPPRRDRVVIGFSGLPRIALDEVGPDWLVWSIRGELSLPVGLTTNRQSRASEEVLVPVEVRLQLVRGSRRLEIEVSVDNRALDHRLRMLFPVAENLEGTWAAGQFAVVHRPVALPADWEAHGNHPAEVFVDAVAERCGFGLLLDGTPEYGVVDTGDGQALALTLLRCTDVLGDNAAFDRVPDAQCLGTIRIRCALVPHRMRWEQAALHREAEEFRLEPLAVQHGATATFRSLQVVHDPHQGPARSPEEELPNPFLPAPPVPDLPLVHSFLRVESSGAVFSACKPAEDGRGLIVRVFNPTEKETPVRIRLDRPIHRAEVCNLEETRERSLEVSTDTVDVWVRAGAILSVRLETDR